MKTYNYPLQIASSPGTRKAIFSLTSVGKTVLQYLTDAMAPSHELRIRQTMNQHGDLIWRVYDPITNRSISIDSEYDLRVWIEQRYYSNPK